MYKLLLCSRYLRTRYIALASIISVTLGVATMIVVNSVMSGFQHEMYQRLHGILSDIVFESHSLSGFPDPEAHMEEIRQVVGDDLAGMTATVRVPAMLSFQIQGQWITRQVMLIGIDEKTYADVGDFSQYLLHPENRKRLSFLLREGGYDDRLDYAGWEYRREQIAYQRAYEEQLEQIGRSRPDAPQDPFQGAPATAPSESSELPPSPDRTGQLIGREPPPPVRPAAATESAATQSGESALAASEPAPVKPPEWEAAGIGQPPGALPGAGGTPADVYDPMKEQSTGIILGISIASLRRRDEDNKVRDYYLCRPGDDVQITLPTAGTPPKAVSDTFTVVDFYESKMSEYDSNLAFVPLGRLQQLRGMIDPAGGTRYVTAIQIKLKKGADLDAVRDKLEARFPASEYPYRIQTWRQLQGPLLAAVQLETMILNILLFLIIAVAGFGILATFFMIVVEKTKDVGVLKSLGAPGSGVMSIFLGYGLLLGVVGSGMGMVLGLLFVVNINRIAKGIEWLTGREVFDQTVYYFQEIPTLINPFTIAWIVAGAMLIAVLASVLPAIRAACLHPVEALRYE